MPVRAFVSEILLIPAPTAIIAEKDETNESEDRKSVGVALIRAFPCSFMLAFPA